jgi:iron complex outermembrane receptor protein
MWKKKPSCNRRTLSLFLFLLMGCCGTALAQNVKITGRVTAPGGAPLPGVSILVKGTTTGTASDQMGNYTISAPGTATLIFTFIGYTKKEEPVNNRTSINAVLAEDDKVLGEVVVTALGIKKEKKQLGYSVTELKGSELAVTNEVNPVNALQGKVAGVQIDQGAGGLFGSSKIVIRGNSTLGNNNQPIFVIDGVIMDNNTFNGTGRDFGNDLKNLNMEDFESVSVLKGSAAAALYGSRAINGVILITTKKGRQQKGIGVNVSQTVNVFQPYSGPEFQNEYGGGTVGDFYTDKRDPNYKANERWRTKVFPTDPGSGKPYIDRQIGRELENWGPRFAGQDVLNYDGTPTKYVAQPNNFMDAFKNGMGYTTNVAMDGGNERSTFRVSYNRDQASGIAYNNNMLKNGFSMRVTHTLNSFLSADVSADYTSFEGKNPPRLGGLDPFGSNNFGKLFTWMLPRNYDTKYWMQKQNYTSKFGGVPDPNNPLETNLVPEARFWFSLFENNYVQREQMVRGRIALTATLNSWAKLQLEGNVNNLYTKLENKELGQLQGFQGGLYHLENSTKESYFMKWMLMMNKTINSDLEVNGYIGGETQNYKTTYLLSETRGGLSYPGSYFIANSKDKPYTEGGLRNSKVFNSLYASADLGYKNQLYLQATFRGDWSSALTYTNGTGNNFFTYPAVSLSWLFSETFKLPSWISYGKLRANLAALGKDTDPFRINPGYEFSGYTYGNGLQLPYSTYSKDPGTNGIVAVQPNLRPERKIAKEIGAEMRFLKNRIGFDISLYQDNTRDQIIPISTPIEAGVPQIIVNAGNIQNKGIEIMIDATPVKTKNFEWSTNLNYSRNRNLIVDLYPGRNELDLGANIGEISTWAVVGKSYGTLRTRIHSATYQAVDADGKPVANPNNGKPILAYRDDGRTAFPKRSDQLQDVGDINARFRGGWGNTFTYKGFSLNVLLDAKIGGDFVLLSYRYGTHTGVYPNTLPGRDADHGGITWTSKYLNDGGTYDDGVIPDGVFAPGQQIKQPDNSMVDVGGMTFAEAYKAGYIEPSHAPQYYYRYGSSSTGVSDFWIKENSWISLRQVSLSYRFPAALCSKLKVNNLSIGVVGRDLFYLYNTLPYNYNPASNNSNNTAYSGEEGFLPMTRSIAGTIRIGF